MNSNHIHLDRGDHFEFIQFLPFAVLTIVYIFAVFLSNRKYKRWPIYRTAFWVLGVACSAMAVTGPLAERMHVDFRAHMVGHLLLGMLAPLFLSFSAPITLVLRTINIKAARRLTRILKGRPVSILSDPAAAAILNVGGLWLLYTTDLYGAMQHYFFLHVFIHIHILLAGYLFTVSIIYIDPTSHQRSFFYRSIVLVIALATHGILSKYIYIHPPSTVSQEQAEAGGMLMYYGGDVVHIMLIFVFCMQWYRASRPRAGLQRTVSS